MLIDIDFDLLLLIPLCEWLDGPRGRILWLLASCLLSIR